MQPTILLSDQELSEKVLDPIAFDTAKALFHRYGFLKIESLYPKMWLADLCHSFLKEIQYDPEKMTLNRGARLHRGRYIVSIPFEPPFNAEDLYANPILLSLMRAFLGEDCILGGLGAIVSLPGAPEQHIHSDFEPLFREQPFLGGVHAPYAITVAIPLVDIDPVNGPTKIWSGTHRAIEIDKAKIDELYERHLLFGSKGCCYFWDYRTYHAGGSNHSDTLRPLLYLSYTRHWFRDLKNPDKVILDNQKIPKEHRVLFPQAEYWNAEIEKQFESKIQALFSPSEEKR